MQLGKALTGFIAGVSIAACSDQQGFPLAASPQIPAALEGNSPSGFVANIGGSVDSTLRVRCLDTNNYPIHGITVHFRVVSGGGSLRDTAAVTGYDGIAASGGWKVGPEPGINAVSASVGNLSTTFYALGTVPDARPLSRYKLVLVNDKPMPYSSLWRDFDSITLTEGSIDVFDQYYARSWTVVDFFLSQYEFTVRGQLTISGNQVELGLLNRSAELRGDSLVVRADLLPDGVQGSFTYVKNR